MDYANGKIYRIVCEETQRQYIGSTRSTLVKRLSNHKHKKNRCSTKDFINPKIFLIEDYPCERKDQLLMRERYHMENTECVNLVRPIISKEENIERRKQYYIDNADVKKQYQKQYRIDNADVKKQYDTQYYIDNADAIKQYRIDNNEKITKYKREKVTCECGSIISRSGLASHKKSRKHQNFVKNINK